MKLDPVWEAKIYDFNARYYGFSMEKLMENAGKGIARVIKEKYSKVKKIGIICGPGNNGGDGLVAARYLYKDFKVQVFLVPCQKNIKSDLARKNWFRFKGEKQDNIKAKDISRDFDVILEGLFGTGLEKKLKEPYFSVVQNLNKMKADKISIDSPVPGFKANLVISLQTPKTPRAYVVDIGLPRRIKERIGPGEIKALSKPEPKSHKGDNGNVLVVAGSKKYHGALLLCSKMAGKIADLVYVCSTPENLELIKKLKSRLSEFIAITEEEIKEIIKKADVILLGPGLETNKETEGIVNGFLKKYKNKKFVLDAGALQVLDKKLLGKNCIITPHKKEFQSLFRINPNRENVTKMAKKYDCVIVLKGSIDYIASPDNLKTNRIGNAGMTKGGTGDVLAGLIAGLASQNDLFLASCAGVFLNGLAAQELKKTRSYLYSASDLIEKIPKVYHKLNNF